MRWIVIALIVLGVLVAIVAFIGSRLPESHRASLEQTFTAAPEVVWRTVTDIEAFPSWRDGVQRVQRLPDRDGRPVWVEDGRSGKMTLAVERLEPPRLLVGRIADPDLPFGGTWTYEITPVHGGSSLRITEDGEIYNPIFRFMARFIFGYQGTIQSYMASLQKRLTQEAKGS
jgi:uncharacterized protein YndB with AHSA1/START domain